MTNVERAAKLKGLRRLGVNPRRAPAMPKVNIGRVIRLRKAEPNSYARFLGSVPAEESDEAFARAVEELTRS